MRPELEKKIDQAIYFIKSVKKDCKWRSFSPLELAYSGGKDSDVILHLAKMADIGLFYPIYKNTTLDPPGTIKHCLDNGVEIRQPKKRFIDIIKRNGFPTRYHRHCCQHLKEYAIFDDVLLGIRKAESVRRQNIYKEPQVCRTYGGRKRVVRQYFPILEWTNEDVEDFITEMNIKCAPVYYDEDGKFHVERRLGCLCCPMQYYKSRIEEFKRYPNMVKLYCRGGGEYFCTHENVLATNAFDNVYEYFCWDVFCEGNFERFDKEFRNSDNDMFKQKIDCKKYLEDFLI